MTPIPPDGTSPSRSSIPSLSGAVPRSSQPGEPSRRRLGIGARNNVSERPIRAQIVIAVVVGLTLLAVPLYLMKKPKSEPSAKMAALPSASFSARPLPPPPEKLPERVKLGAPQRVRCGATARGGQEGGFCDQLSTFEHALAKAIRESDSCAPRVPKPSSLNFVLTVDFEKKKLHVYPGASGDLRGSSARRVTECVKRALAGTSFDGIRHLYRHYAIAILATYEPEPVVGAQGPPSRPRFD